MRARPLSKSVGTNKPSEWSGSGRVVACIAVRLRRGRRDLSAWRPAGAQLAGCGGAGKRGWDRRELVDANRVATGQRTLKRAKQGLRVERIYRSKDMAFARKRCQAAIMGNSRWI